MDIIRTLEKEQIREDIENFNIGDTVKVYYKIVEGKTERIQVFEGLCIAKKREGIRKTFTVRKISYNVGVERTFPVNSPKIDKIEVIRFGKVRKSKLYYMRSRVGKAAKVAELIRKKTDIKKRKHAKKQEKVKAEVENKKDTVKTAEPEVKKQEK